MSAPSLWIGGSRTSLSTPQPVARSAHCRIQLSRRCPRLSLRADTGSEPGQEEEQRAVSARCEAPLRLRGRRSADISASRAASPAGKALQIAPEFHIFLLSLCCQSSTCPCTAKTEETAAGSRRLSRPEPRAACETRGC